tara:strand:- start:7051 stop:7527 length:477 start_codon:yes stop_codon:yes gene_type:complete
MVFRSICAAFAEGQILLASAAFVAMAFDPDTGIWIGDHPSGLSALDQTRPGCVVQKLGPDGLKIYFITHQIGHGESVKMAQKGFHSVGENMAEAANRTDDTAIALLVETLDKGAVIFERADDRADIDGVGGLVQQQSTAASADAIDKTFRHQSLGNLH